MVRLVLLGYRTGASGAGGWASVTTLLAAIKSVFRQTSRVARSLVLNFLMDVVDVVDKIVNVENC